MFLDISTTDSVAPADDFDVLLKLAGRRTSGQESNVAERDVLGHARSLLPICCVVRADLLPDSDGTNRLSGFTMLREPFLLPEGTFTRRVGDDDSGYDLEWDYQSVNDAIPDDHEISSLPTDPRTEELNDEADGSFEPLPETVCSVFEPEAPKLYARLLFDAELPTADDTYLVSDYAIDDGHVVILLEPFQLSRKSVDPARHDSTVCFEEVEVEFLDRVEDSVWSFLRFQVTPALALVGK